MNKPTIELEEFARRRWSLVREGRLVSLDVDVFLTQDACWISRLYTPPPIRRKGYAREAMQLLCDAADREDVKLVLSINSYGDMSCSALKGFYMRMGFRTDPAHAQDLRDDGFMSREPRQPVESCCGKEDRSMSGGCQVCGDPSL